jgi:heme-degrading monooxygenase HmoA
MIANTPKPPYYAVIFTSILTNKVDGYSEMAHAMELEVSRQDGFLGYESARNELGITVSYWRDLESIRHWKKNRKHQLAQSKGKSDWYTAYKVRICKVEKDYDKL